MEKLTERIKKCIVAYQLPPWGIEVDGAIELLHDVLEKLTEYEDLEEQGRLVKLPCKIGTEVYDITWWDDVEEKVVVKGKAYYRTVRKHKITKFPFTYSDINDFGKTVFLTKAEAEQKLKEMESD